MYDEQGVKATLRICIRHKRWSLTTGGVGYHTGGIPYPEIPRKTACLAIGGAQVRVVPYLHLENQAPT